MNLLNKLPKISAYGYSKSLNLFLELSDQQFKFPKNYVLNLSNGGKFDVLHKFLINLPFVRMYLLMYVRIHITFMYISLFMYVYSALESLITPKKANLLRTQRLFAY